MKNILALTKRNCLLFFRSKSTFFFSIFSSLILISLYFLFIGKLYAQGFNETAGQALTSNQLYAAIYSQMIVGVLVINSVSLSTGSFTFMAVDLEKGKAHALLITKINRTQLVLSYLFAAIIISFSINIIMFIISTILIGAITGIFLGAAAFFSVVGVLAITTLVSCAIMLLIVSIVRASAAIGIINGVLGTILGFLCGIYMPYTNLGTAAKYVGSFLPFTHLTIWLKQIVLSDVFSQIGLPNQISSQMQEVWFSAGNVGLCGLNIPLWGMIVMSIIFAACCLLISALLLKNYTFKTKKPHKQKN